MNNLAYSSQQPDKVAPQIEEKVREDLEAPAALPYSVKNAGAELGVGAFLKDAATFIFGGRPDQIFTMTISPTSPRAFELHVNVDRQGLGCRVGVLMFSTTLSRTAKGEVKLEGPKIFGTSKFQGDADTSARLNGSKDLLKRMDKLARTKANIGGVDTTLERYVRIVPEPGGTRLVVGSLPRSTKMGFGATTDAKEFCELAGLIETLL